MVFSHFLPFRSRSYCFINEKEKYLFLAIEKVPFECFFVYCFLPNVLDDVSHFSVLFWLELEFSIYIIYIVYGFHVLLGSHIRSIAFAIIKLIYSIISHCKKRTVTMNYLMNRTCVKWVNLYFSLKESLW